MRKVKIAINGKDIPDLVRYLQAHGSNRQDNLIECMIDNMYQEMADVWADVWARNRYRLQGKKNPIVRKEFNYSHAMLFFSTFNGKNEDPGLHSITQQICTQIEHQLFIAGPFTLKPTGQVYATQLLNN